MSLEPESFKHYRDLALGETLMETLNTLVESGVIDGTLANRILVNFDRTVAKVLANDAKGIVVVKGQVTEYKNVDEVWFFSLKKAVIKIDGGIGKHGSQHTVDKFVITAHNGQQSGEASGVTRRGRR